VKDSHDEVQSEKNKQGKSVRGNFLAEKKKKKKRGKEQQKKKKVL